MIADVKVPPGLLYKQVVDAGRVDERGEPCKRACSIMCAVPINCEHDRDVCDICDFCSCGKCPSLEWQQS